MQGSFSTRQRQSSTTREQVGTCDVRVIESAAGAELYITATPCAGSAERQARDLYEKVARAVREGGAAIVEERLFAAVDAMAAGLAARAAAYGELDDGVRPTLLETRGGQGRIVGAQVHAIRGIAKPRVVRCGERPLGRAFECGGYRYLTASGLNAPELVGGPAQTRWAFEAAEGLLAQGGGTLADLARTWIWMDDILSWYPQLNQVRTAFFTERGLMKVAGRMPASTGIGVSPAGAKVAIDLFAAWGGSGAVERFHAAGNQRSAYEYGSAFARAAKVKTPGGVTVFCSGTAAIDTKGNSCFGGDVAGQVRMTVENVLAVLRDLGCGSGDVVQAMAYCVNEQVEDCFIAGYSQELEWPCLTMMGEVCRGDLLFEVEVTACPKAGG